MTAWPAPKQQQAGRSPGGATHTLRACTACAAAASRRKAHVTARQWSKAWRARLSRLASTTSCEQRAMIAADLS
jgi:hypothetical protein